MSNKKTTTPTSSNSQPAVSASRTSRKRVYEQVRETDVPDYVKTHFAKDGWELKLVRWKSGGEANDRHLSRREKEGYEFVTADEVPEQYLTDVEISSTRGRKGLLTTGDLCLMKVDIDLRQSRTDYYNKKTDDQLDAVSIGTMERKGFKDLGSSSKVTMKEPTFAS